MLCDGKQKKTSKLNGKKKSVKWSRPVIYQRPINFCEMIVVVETKKKSYLALVGVMTRITKK